MGRIIGVWLPASENLRSCCQIHDREQKDLKRWDEKGKGNVLKGEYEGILKKVIKNRIQNCRFLMRENGIKFFKFEFD
jgi:hypothetical protein